MLNDYSATASNIWANGGYEQVTFTLKLDVAPNTHKRDCCIIPGSERRQQKNDKSRVTYNICQKKGHFSYECKSSAPVPQDEEVLHLNVKERNK